MASAVSKAKKYAAARSAVRNDILRALLGSDYRYLRPKLERVRLRPGEVVYQADQRIEYVYFPEDAVVAMIDTTEEGGTVEVGIIGHEGMVGINFFLGSLTTPDKAVVQLPGSAMRMKASDLGNELRFGSPLQQLLLRYSQALLAIISQSVACSQHHNVARRLARLLLTMQRYAGAGGFDMSQQAIAAMLGARRAGVSEAAAKLQAEGLMAYSRGRIRILDEAGLQRKSCGCYRFIKQQLDALLRDVPRFLPAQ